MSVVSYSFLAFLFVSVFIYYIVPGKIQWGVLLLASLAFYGYAGIPYLILVITEALAVYVISRAMQKNLDRQDELLVQADRKTARKIKNEMKEGRKRYLVAALVILIGILAVFKGTGFVVENINRVLLHLKKEPLTAVHIIAPLGISFYTFMMISYLMDLYRGKISAQKNFLKYLTYVLYFPHVTQGPIARYEETASQMFTPHKFDYDVLTKGLWLMLWGFFKKLVIADRLSVFVTEVFGNSVNYRGPIFFIAAVLYSIQIYCDFSGCMDIVCGVSECFGIRLADNFIRPYFSQTLPEFWRRWHASLGAFFREYVFYPVSTSEVFLKLNTRARNRFGNTWGRNIASCLPILCVWILTGIWHGCSWNYIGWGLFHGCLICMSTLFEQPLAALTAKLKIRTDSVVWMIFRMLRTFFLCVIGRIIFIGNGIRNSLWMLKSCIVDMGYRYHLVEDFPLNQRQWTVLALSCLILFGVSLAQELRMKQKKEGTIRDWLAERNLVFRWIVLLTGIMFILIFGVYGSGIGVKFIYEQF